MKKCFHQLGRFLLRISIFCMVSVVILQGTVTLQPLRLFYGWPEILPVQPQTWPVHSSAVHTAETGMTIEQGSLTLALKDFAALPYCRILVNGKEMACFQEQKVVLSLEDGDWLEVDASYYNFPVALEVQAVSENTVYPRLDQQFQVQQGIVWLGEVQISDE